MPRFFQPPVTPLPNGINLRGQVAIVTGASSGIGVEIAAQLLQLEASTVILAVRNLVRGEDVRRSLLNRPSIKDTNPNAIVEVMELDMESYDSVISFSRTFRDKYTKLHLLMLNAGIGTLTREMAPTGHEKNIQVNFLSNVLLMLELLPILFATSDKRGIPTRVTWTSSRMHANTALAKKAPLQPGETVLSHFDSEASFLPFSRYGDSKLLGILFLNEMRSHLPGDKVIINSFCPGMVDTSMSNVLPIYIRLPVHAIKALRARSPEKAAWIGLYAATIADLESHGELLADKDIMPPSAYIASVDGKKVQKMLWNEMTEEMTKLTAIPPWMKAI